jgi:hypothetical protein
MGPTCEVLLDAAPDEAVLRFVDTLLTEAAEKIERTRKLHAPCAGEDPSGRCRAAR